MIRGTWKSWKTALNAVVFIGAVAGTLMASSAKPVSAATKTTYKQCWYFWWQDPQCTFCAGDCLPGGDCCSYNES